MPLFGKHEPYNYDYTQTQKLIPREKWIPYRENGEVKYVLAEDAQDFTATGGPVTHRSYSGWANAPASYLANVPTLLPERFTDDSVVPVVVTHIVPASKPTPEVKERKKSFIGKLKKDKEPSTSKVVFMPRREYKKYFAKDNAGNYIGTEPQREWTEEELTAEFGQYHKVLGKAHHAS